MPEKFTKIIAVGDEGFTKKGDSWKIVTDKGINGKTALTSSKTDVATWTFTEIENGSYGVFLFWTANPNRPQKVRYILEHDRTVDIVWVDQKRKPDELQISLTGWPRSWKYAGQISVKDGKLVVRQDYAFDDGVRDADAVQIVKQD
jgi:hypothetical protein